MYLYLLFPKTLLWLCVAWKINDLIVIISENFSFLHGPHTFVMVYTHKLFIIYVSKWWWSYFPTLRWLLPCWWGHSKVAEPSVERTCSSLWSQGMGGVLWQVRVLVMGPPRWQNDSETHSGSPCSHGSCRIGLLVAMVSSGEVSFTEKGGMRESWSLFWRDLC